MIRHNGFVEYQSIFLVEIRDLLTLSRVGFHYLGDFTEGRDQGTLDVLEGPY